MQAIKPALAIAPANLLTRDVREADANSLKLSKTLPAPGGVGVDPSRNFP